MRQIALALLEERLSREYKPRVKQGLDVIDLLPPNHPVRQNDVELTLKRYGDMGFVGAMLERQFGNLLDPLGRPGLRKSTTSPDAQGSEPYYAALTALLRLSAGSTLNDGPMTHLDLGTGVGRLIASSADLGASLALGLDLFPLPLRYAHQLIVDSDRVEIPLRTTRGKHEVVAVDGLGRRSAVLARGDASVLPLEDQSFELVSCCNLLHRVANPKQVLSEAMRVTRAGGYLLISNSYDWDEDFTDPTLWFDDVLDLVGRPEDIGWSIQTRMDPIPYFSRIHDRKYTYALNDIVLLRREP